MKTMNKNKTYWKKKCDVLVSKIVRLQGVCEWCGTTQGQLQCAHIVGRSNHTLRFDLQNVLCFCATCHRKAHNDPLGFATWFDKNFPNRREYLDMNKNHLTHRKLNDYKEMVKMLEIVYDSKREPMLTV